MSCHSPIIVALDVPSATQALQLGRQLDSRKCRLKVGKELFTRAGPELVEALQKQGFEIFLDLKFHDIPNTTAAAVRAAADLGVWMVNVHASGGRQMLTACREGLVAFSAPPILIAVTVLTSQDDAALAETGLTCGVGEQVTRLAKLAADCGLDGVVCSAREAGLIRQLCGENFQRVTPGIRPLGSAANDQKRIMSPAAAMQAGSHYLVIGRPITRASEPSQVLDEILTELDYDQRSA